MANCKITQGVDLSCTAQRKVGGTRQRLWLVTQLEGFNVSVDSDGYVDSLTFDTYEGLKKFTGPKDGHSGGYTVQVTEGGNRFFQHNVQISLLPDTPVEDDAIQEIISGDFPVILEDRNGEFFLYGATNGMSATEGTQNTGTTATSNIADVLTMAGDEKAKPFRVFVTDRATTLSLLEGYEV